MLGVSSQNAESLPLTCAVGEDPEQEHRPGHGGDTHWMQPPLAPGLEDGVFGPFMPPRPIRRRRCFVQISSSVFLPNCHPDVPWRDLEIDRCCDLTTPVTAL